MSVQVKFLHIVFAATWIITSSLEYPEEVWCSPSMPWPCWQNRAAITINGQDVTNSTFDGIQGLGLDIVCHVWTNYNKTGLGPTLVVFHNIVRYRNAKIISSGDDKKVDYRNRTLSLPPLTNKESGWYGCRSQSNFAVWQMAWINLEIQESAALNFTEEPNFEGNSSLIVNEGDSVTLTCNATGYPYPNYKWLHDNQTLNTTNDRLITITNFDAGSVLSINSTLEKNSGQYVCYTSNWFHGTIQSHAFMLTVIRTVVPGTTPMMLTSSDVSSSSVGLQASMITVACLVIIIIIILAVIIRKKWSNIWTRQITLEVENENYFTNINLGYVNFADEEKWKIDRSQVTLGEVIGEGAFGVVLKGQLSTFGQETTTVAVKKLKDGHWNNQEKIDLINELKLMQKIDPHPNIVNLIGCCIEKDPVYVIIEYANYGNLLNYLQAYRKDIPNLAREVYYVELLSFAHHIAKGMAYLSSIQMLHRDLACRNILLGENKVCKVADFGLSRDVINSHLYVKKTKGKMPLRWMALESIFDSIYTTESDVWSFGIVMWEILSLGSCPYPTLSCEEIIQNLKVGYRMSKPHHCDDYLYEVMLSCWNKDSKNRPTFKTLQEKLSALLDSKLDFEIIENS